MNLTPMLRDSDEPAARDTYGAMPRLDALARRIPRAATRAIALSLVALLVFGGAQSLLDEHV